MKPLISLLFLSLLACTKTNDIPNSDSEPWTIVFPQITEPILDARVNGSEFHCITDNFFYRILGEEILEKRALTGDHYKSYSSPVLGSELIFRLINFDTAAYLEFQPIKPGGTVKRISYDELGDDKLTFPITHGFGGRSAGRFDEQGYFLFVGFDYPSLQQFVTRLSIDYDSTSNTILDIHIAERVNLDPDSTPYGGIYRAEDVFVADGIIFISCGHGGVFRCTQDAVDYFPHVTLLSVFSEGDHFIGADLSRNILTSPDLGMAWVATSSSLHEGWTLLKEGDYYIESTEHNQIFRTGKDINELIPFSFPPYSDVPFHFAFIKYYDSSYFLFGSIDGNPAMFRRSALVL